MGSPSNPGASIATRLVETGLRLEHRGWALGTSGNFSAVLARDPLRLAITASGIDKASLAERDIVEVDDRAQLVRGNGRPSAEAHLHVAVVRARGAGASGQVSKASPLSRPHPALSRGERVLGGLGGQAGRQGSQ